MFCPKCGAEYREGFTRCADCDVNLVSEPPERPADTDVEFVEVCTPVDMNQVVFIKSLLSSEGIPFHIQGEHHNSIFGPRVVPFRVLVPKEQSERAKELLADLK